MITVFLIAFNEHDMLPYQLEHSWDYADRIVILDNCSTDDTSKIATLAGCEVVKFDTGGQVRDDVIVDMLNNAHRRASEGWIFTHAVDEFPYPAISDMLGLLEEYDAAGYNAIVTEGYNMIGEAAKLPPGRITQHVRRGVRDPQFLDKLIAYKKGIRPNYSAGCHHASPIGEVRYAPHGDIYLLHYKFGLGLERIEARNRGLVLSEVNRRNGWAWHVKQDGHAKSAYEYLLTNAVEVI